MQNTTNSSPCTTYSHWPNVSGSFSERMNAGAAIMEIPKSVLAAIATEKDSSSMART